MLFQQEFYGYNKKEVEDFLKRLKTTYEAKLMAEKLKVLDSEKQLLNLKSEEKKIMGALDVLEKQKKYQEEGSKRIYGLVINKLELLVDQLNERFPQLKSDKEFSDILGELSKIVVSFKNGTLDGTTIFRPISQENDSMRVLLQKMQEHRKESSQKTEESAQQKNNETPSTYVPPMAIPDGDSGFSFAEALNPTDDLDEIMKAFDFYGD